MAIIFDAPRGPFDAFATGLGSALNQLAANKMENLQRQQSLQRGASGLQALGFAPQEALSVAGLDPSIQREIVKQKLLQPGNEAYLQALQGILGGQEGQQPSAQNIPEQIVGGQGASSIIGTKGINQQQATKLAELGMKKQESQRQEKYQNRKLGIQTADAIRKYNEPWIKKNEKADADIKSYNRIIKETESGKVRTGFERAFADKLGIADFTASPSEAIVAKEIGRLATNVGDAFGSTSRITNYLESVFQRSLPSLWNNKDGILAISKVNLAAAEAFKIKNDIRKQLVRQYQKEDFLPPDIDDQINELAKPQLDELENRTMQEVQQIIDKHEGKPVGISRENWDKSKKYVQKGKIMAFKDGQWKPIGKV